MDPQVILGVIGFWFPVVAYAVWHAARQPDERWAAIGESKTTWIVFMAGGYFIAGIGVFVALYYCVSLRGQLEKAGVEAPPHPQPL